MSEDRTVLEHLLDGRDALVLEVNRLMTAIEELDSVIERVGGDAGRSAATAGTRATPAQSRLAGTRPAGPVNSAGSGGTRRTRVPSRAGTGPARRTATRKATSTARRDGGPKSIRVHVLEMLAGDDREFGLAEIIDRVHAVGIQAHDDAVRSITTKLMKDGQVERVGRGQYRLARGAGTVTGSSPAGGSPGAEAGTESITEVGAASQAPPAGPTTGTPPLNLAAPWERNS